MTANWAFAPVCGVDFWRVIVTSPEVLIFLFFMITDPKTVPAGRVGRIVFGVLVAVASTLLMAPQTNEFGTKVGLLAGLVVVCAARPLLDRLLPEPRSAADDLRRFATGSLIGGDGRGRRPGRASGRPDRGRRLRRSGPGSSSPGPRPAASWSPDTAEVLDGVPHRVDPATLPGHHRRCAGLGGRHERADRAGDPGDARREPGAREPGAAATRREPAHRRRSRRPAGRDAGPARRTPTASGRTVIDHYRFDSVHVVVIAPFGVQTGGSLGFESRGTVTTETYDAGGALLDTKTSPFERTFAVRAADRRSLDDRGRPAAGRLALNPATGAPGAAYLSATSTRTTGEGDHGT